MTTAIIRLKTVQTIYLSCYFSTGEGFCVFPFKMFFLSYDRDGHIFVETQTDFNKISTVDSIFIHPYEFLIRAWKCIPCFYNSTWWFSRELQSSAISLLVFIRMVVILLPKEYRHQNVTTGLGLLNNTNSIVS